MDQCAHVIVASDRYSDIGMQVCHGQVIVVALDIKALPQEQKQQSNCQLRAVVLTAGPLLYVGMTLKCQLLPQQHYKHHTIMSGIHVWPTSSLLDALQRHSGPAVVYQVALASPDRLLLPVLDLECSSTEMYV